jgi:hypothetical protein
LNTAEEDIVTSKAIAKRGPKTPEGKLAVRFNASTHGIRSPRPVVAAFESEGAWKAHREAILESLSPEGGMEEALAERVALNLWRLNRVTVYETESIASEQEAVQEAVRRDREHALKFATLNPREARDIVAGTYLEELVNDPSELSDYAIEMLAPPGVSLEGVEVRRKHYETTVPLFDASPDTTISRADASWLIEKAPYFAVEAAAFHQEERDDIPEEERSTDEEIRERSAPLEEQLCERLVDKDTFTVGELREHLEWVALEAGMEDEYGGDGQVAYTPLEGLLEKLHYMAQSALIKAERQARKVEKQLLEKRRERILPSEQDMAKVGRYEAHLSRELYRALHELEALQTRRGGGAAPLGRVDVQI